MKSRSSSANPHEIAIPTSWQCESPSPCIRIELSCGDIHLFSYQHFITAALTRADSGVETVRIAFSSHDVEIEGRGLRNLLADLQDFGVKWMRVAPSRYHELARETGGVIVAIRVAATT